MNTPYLKKYQPKLYKDFTIDKEYIELLNTMKKIDNLNILLVGDSGCGKTSLIYASIREYYQLEKIPHQNIMLINNLKEQGIQYYRTEVKTFCQTTSCISGKKKFIVIDDIDLINEQSQQVFRNCIDKYNHNVHFLCSCTNTQKVIDSIQSRCAIIKIKPIQKNILKHILKKIKKKENIIIDDEAEEFVLLICNNSIRLLINYLEKFKLINEVINLEKATNICTNISFYEFKKYTNSWLVEKNLESASNTILDIYKKGYSVIDIFDTYFNFIKLSKDINEELKYKIIKIILKYISLFYTLHENDIELIFFTNDLFNLE
jgi:replication factor C subunit 2/4